MRTTILALVALMAPGLVCAQEEANWHVGLRGGEHYFEDQAFDFVSEDALYGTAELSVDVRVWDALWVGLAWRAGGTADAVHQTITTDWAVDELRASAQWRLRPALPLAVFGRLGPAVAWNDLTLESGGRTLTAADWTFGAHAGLGVELFPLHRALVEGMEDDLGFGVSLEATYARFRPLELESGGVRLGTFDPSGPGWLLGLVAQW